MEERNKHRGCKVWFNNGSIKIFYGWWTNVISEIMAYCDEHKLETVSSEWFNHKS